MKKDIINLILYIIALSLTTIVVSFAICMSLVIGLELMQNPFWDTLLDKHRFIDNSIYILGVFCIITSFFFPVIITKLFLDKNWSKYITYFYDHIQYPTIVLICYILVRKLILLNNPDIEEYQFPLCDYWVYSVYGLVFVKKFIKPLYKYFWILYFIFAITVIIISINYLMSQ